MTTQALSRRDFGWLLAGAGLAAAMPARAAAPSNWQLGFTTAPDELDGNLTLLSGRLPADLSGVLYRAGPGQFERAGERLGHWFDGDGMIQRFAIADGRVRHRARFVDTPKRRAETAAGRFLYSGYGFAPREAVGFTRPDDLNAANTNVLPVGDEVWALWEGGSPWRVDGTDLASIGRRQFPSALDGVAFSAHPKRGPDGEIWNFGGFGSRCVIWRLDRAGNVLGAWPLELQHPTLMHDFLVTRTRIVLVAPPMQSAAGDARSLLDRFVWSPDQPMTVYVLDKNDPTSRRAYELPAHFLFHLGNAWEDESGTIRFDAFLFDDASFATEVTRAWPQGRYVEPPLARPSLITLHADGRAELERLQGAGEFPRIDPRLVGERHRYTYGVTPGGVARWDWRTGRRAIVDYGADYWAEEPIFVPRRGEGRDGWIVQTRLNLRSAQTELVVLDARGVEDGPVAVLACPYALPLGFHGAFVEL
jgi:all-trans-8'-apo-beta-carotenal 15,15'-oxygenase